MKPALILVLAGVVALASARYLDSGLDRAFRRDLGYDSDRSGAVAGGAGEEVAAGTLVVSQEGKSGPEQIAVGQAYAKKGAVVSSSSSSSMKYRNDDSHNKGSGSARTSRRDLGYDSDRSGAKAGGVGEEVDAGTLVVSQEGKSGPEQIAIGQASAKKGAVVSSASSSSMKYRNDEKSHNKDSGSARTSRRDLGYDSDRSGAEAGGAGEEVASGTLVASQEGKSGPEQIAISQASAKKGAVVSSASSSSIKYRNDKESQNKGSGSYRTSRRDLGYDSDRSGAKAGGAGEEVASGTLVASQEGKSGPERIAIGQASAKKGAVVSSASSSSMKYRNDEESHNKGSGSARTSRRDLGYDSDRSGAKAGGAGEEVAAGTLVVSQEGKSGPEQLAVGQAYAKKGAVVSSSSIGSLKYRNDEESQSKK